MKTQNQIIQEAYIGMVENKSGFRRAMNSNNGKRSLESIEHNKITSDNLLHNLNDELDKEDHTNTVRDMFDTHTTYNPNDSLNYFGTRGNINKALEYHQKKFGIK